MGWFKKIKKKVKKAVKKVAKVAVPAAASFAGNAFLPGIGGQIGGALGSSLVGGGGGFAPQEGGNGLPSWMNQIGGAFGGGEDGGVDWGSLIGGGLQGAQQIFGGGGGQQGGMGGLAGMLPPAAMAMLASQMGGKLPDQPNWMELARLTAESEKGAGFRGDAGSRNNMSNTEGSSTWTPNVITDPLTGQQSVQWQNTVTLDPALKALQDSQRAGNLQRQQNANSMLPGAGSPLTQPLDYSQFGSGGAASRPSNTGYDTGGAPPGMLNGGAGGGGGVASGAFGGPGALPSGAGPLPWMTQRPAPTGPVSSATPGTRQPPTTGGAQKFVDPARPQVQPAKPAAPTAPKTTTANGKVLTKVTTPAQTTRSGRPYMSPTQQLSGWMAGGQGTNEVNPAFWRR